MTTPDANPNTCGATCSPDDLRKVRECIGLLNSMVMCGEDHDDDTRRCVIEALKIVEDMISPPRCSALIRRCDGCQTVTAIDLDNTLKHKREMQMLGQTVYEITEEEARTHFKSAGPCRCGQNNNLSGGR